MQSFHSTLVVEVGWRKVLVDIDGARGTGAMPDSEQRL